MVSEIISNALSIADAYITQHYSSEEQKMIRKEMVELTGISNQMGNSKEEYGSYEEVQAVLSCLNEKESIRKDKGVYYTPSDVVKFITVNSAKLACAALKPDNLHVTDLSGIPCRTFCCEKAVYDPTCGAGVFLLAALEMKLNLLDLHYVQAAKRQIQEIVASINGNDLNGESIVITKVRLFLCVLHRYGVKKATGLAKIMNRCFTSYDFVTARAEGDKKYDIIMGNPPYVEDAKSESMPDKRYGNIYANVLENAALHLNPGGVIGFVIPLSYVATLRMKKIRDVLYERVSEQYILSYSDRPDCLFASVHQKLCILLGRNSGMDRFIYTGNYRYWYKEERQELFRTAQVVANHYVTGDYVPKLGTSLDSDIYRKVQGMNTPLIQFFGYDGAAVYLNMRAAFWIKAFLGEHTGAEYKVFWCQDEEYAGFCMCLLNSSLFWWYWICISDCWHITKKELSGFMVPDGCDFQEANRLARLLEDRLEETKRYIGSRQTEYEYKHKDCVDEIHQIDDYIHALYGLTEEEGLYIKQFAYRYRISGGILREGD